MRSYQPNRRCGFDGIDKFAEDEDLPTQITGLQDMCKGKGVALALDKPGTGSAELPEWGDIQLYQDTVEANRREFESDTPGE